MASTLIMSRTTLLNDIKVECYHNKAFSQSDLAFSFRARIDSEFLEEILPGFELRAFYEIWCSAVWD
jgi:hypothetical protein